MVDMSASPCPPSRTRPEDRESDPEPGDEHTRERARTTAGIDRGVARSHTSGVGELLGQGERVPTHVGVVSRTGDTERTRTFDFAHRDLHTLAARRAYDAGWRTGQSWRDEDPIGDLLGAHTCRRASGNALAGEPACMTHRPPGWVPYEVAAPTGSACTFLNVGQGEVAREDAGADLTSERWVGFLARPHL